MLIALLTVTFLVAAATVVLWIGKGDFRRGKLRSIRRVRTTRRRFLQPLRAKLKRTAVLAWSKPTRTAVDFQIRRVADRVERASAAADQFVAAEHRLEKMLAQLKEMQPPDWSDSWSPRQGKVKPPPRTPGRGWTSGLALGLSAAAAAAGNGWLLYEYILPALPELALVPSTVDSLTIGLAFAVLPFLLGLLYFALSAAGRSFVLRMLAALVVLLVVALGAAEGITAVLALEAMGVVALTWWGGIAIATLLGGLAALLPPTVAALAHAAMERLEHWMAARERHRMGELVRQDRISGRMRETLGSMTSGVQTLTTEVRALGSEPAGRLILYPDSSPTVERAGAVLRRLSASVARDAQGTLVRETRLAEVVARVLGHLFALGVWLLAAAGALSIAAGGLRYGAEVGVTGLMTAAAFAAMTALLLGGLVLRLLFSSPGLRFGAAARAMMVLLLGLAAASLAAVLAPLTAGVDGSLFEGRALVAGAWLNLMLLVSAIASTQLREGVAAAGGLITYVLTAVARLVLAIVDVALLGLDRVLGGRRSSRTRRRRPSFQSGPRPPAPTPGAHAGRY